MHTPTTASRAARWGRHAALILLSAVAALACRAEVPETKQKDAAVAKPVIVSAETLAQRIKAAQGKPLVVNFWATWCPPCVEEMPQLAQFHRDYATRGVTFISVSADDPADLASGKIEAFAKEHKLPFPVLVLDGADPEAIGEALDVELASLPVTFVYDAEGKVRQKWETAITTKQLSETVDPLL